MKQIYRTIIMCLILTNPSALICFKKMVYSVCGKKKTFKSYFKLNNKNIILNVLVSITRHNLASYSVEISNRQN